MVDKEKIRMNLEVGLLEKIMNIMCEATGNEHKGNFDKGRIAGLRDALRLVDDELEDKENDTQEIPKERKKLRGEEAMHDWLRRKDKKPRTLTEIELIEGLDIINLYEKFTHVCRLLHEILEKINEVGDLHTLVEIEYMLESQEEYARQRNITTKINKIIKESEAFHTKEEK